MAMGFGMGLSSGWGSKGWAPWEVTNDKMCYSLAFVLGSGFVSAH